LATKHPTVVISSPLQRAVATARAIGEAAGAAVVIDAELNDRDYGPWNGKPRTEVVHRYGSIDAAPGVEPLATVAARARTALDHLVGQYGCGPLVLVSHDAVNRALLEQLDPSLTDIGQRTACWTNSAASTAPGESTATTSNPTSHVVRRRRSSIPPIGADCSRRPRIWTYH